MAKNKKVESTSSSLSNSDGNVEQPKRKVGRPIKTNKVITKSTQLGTKDGEERATFILRQELIENIKTIAYWDRQLLKETIDIALDAYVKAWIKKNGVLKSRPDQVKARDSKRSNSGRPSSK
jgi:hypothetical protein